MRVAHCLDSFLLCILLSAVVLRPAACRRSKRIVGGEPLLERNPKSMPYDAVRWYAWIGDSYGACSHSLWNKFGHAVWEKRCAPVPEDLECGGALIAPFLIQTACHCLSVWTFKAKFDYTVKKIPWLPASVIHSWEDRKDLYLGYNQVNSFKYYAQSGGFFLHQKCAQTAKNYAGVTTHDFGWIRLTKPIWETDYDNLGFFIDYTPIYVEETLKKVTHEALSTRAMCLVMGFGNTGEGKSSNVLKHAWNQLVDHQTCYRISFTYRKLDIGWGAKEIIEGESWACARPGLGKVGGTHSSGDSGSPITCNKHYIFLVSASGTIDKDDDDEDFPPVGDITDFMIEATLTYAMKENAYEYREAFLDEAWYKDPNNPELRSFQENRQLRGFSKPPRARITTRRTATAAASFLTNPSVLPNLILQIFSYSNF